MKKRILCVLFLIVLFLCNSVCAFATESETVDFEEGSYEETVVEDTTYPFQSFADKSIPGISVEGSADEGVFPSGTTMSVIQVSSDKKEQIKEATNVFFNGNKKTVELIALDISFLYEDEIINPKEGKTVQLVIRSGGLVEEKEYIVVCFKNENSIEIIPSTETIITDLNSAETASTGMSIIKEDVSNYKKEISFEIKESSVYAIVETEDVTSSTNVDNTEINQNEVEETDNFVDQSEEEADTSVSENVEVIDNSSNQNEEDSNETSNNQDAEVDNETLIDKNKADSENTSDSHDKEEKTEKADNSDEQKKTVKSEKSTEQKETKKTENSTEQKETKKSESSTKQNTENENEKTKVSVNLIWNDSNNNDRVRPESVKIELYADGKKVKETYISENDDWKRTFENLPKFKDGKEISYTIRQKKIKHYDPPEINKFDITNTHEPEKIMIEGIITWDDSSNKDGIRPETVYVSFKNDGITETAIVSRITGWKYSFGPHPKYESGKEIAYTIEELPIDGYTPKYFEGSFNITNIHEAGTVDVSASNNNSDKAPKVGDNNNVLLWILVVILSIGVAVYLIIFRKNN